MARHLGAIPLLLFGPVATVPASPTASPPPAADYDVVYVRAPRFGDNTLSHWNDTLDPWTPDPGSELVLWHHTSHVHSVLFPKQEHIDSGLIDTPALGLGAVADPSVSFDGKEVLFTYFHHVTSTAPHQLSAAGSDIYRLELSSGNVTRLTFQEYTPNTGLGFTYSGNGSAPTGNNPRLGVFNSGPTWLPNPLGLEAGPGRIAFTSTRNNYVAKTRTPDDRASQLFVMDPDGRNVELIAPFNLGRALHPFVLTDGRIIFTSWENEGIRADTQFPLWQIHPDGTNWMSVSGAFERNVGHHFHTQNSDGDVVTATYYNINNNGFGELLKFPAPGPEAAFWGVAGPPAGNEREGIPFEPRSSVRLTPFTTNQDFPAPLLPDMTFAGKFTHPSAAPDNDLLVVWTPGPANHRLKVEVPTYDGGIYLLKNSAVLGHPDELVTIFRFGNDPNYNEQWPRAVVPYKRIYGIPQPAVLPQVANDGSTHPELPAGTPFALIGGSSVEYRETDPNGGDPFNVPPHTANSYRWFYQGTDTSLYSDSEIHSMRILVLPPLSDLTWYGGFNAQYFSLGVERTRILGEFPLRKPSDPTDTSFLAKIPADTPFTFQVLDDKGRALFLSQTWHSLPPGEMFTCGGCHVHSQTGIDFSTTVAGQPGYVPDDLTQATPLLTVDDATGETSFVTDPQQSVTLEYFRDVQPIFQAKCIGCHTQTPQAPFTFDDVMRLDLDADDELVLTPWPDWPGTYFRLAEDDQAMYGLPPMSTFGAWFEPQATRYIRDYQSRQSLLAWKVWGERLDGRTNAERPTETTPGDPATFPAGANREDADIDFVGEIMPPPSSGLSLTNDEKLAITRWIDIGVPIHFAATPDHHRGFFSDHVRPTLYASPTVEQARQALVSEVVVGAYDLESGLEASTLEVTFDVAIDTAPAGTNFAAGMTPAADGRLTVPLPVPVDLAGSGATMTVCISDMVGHRTEIVRTFHRAPDLSPVHVREAPERISFQ